MDCRPIWGSFAGGAVAHRFSGGQATGTKEKSSQTPRRSEELNLIYIIEDIVGMERI